MKNNTVNFGKIYKINAPLFVSQDIAEIANNANHNNQEINKQVREIISDANTGKVYSFAYGYGDESSYIFTGIEGKKFYNSYNKAMRDTNVILNYYSKNLAKMHTELVWNDHRDYITKMISESPDITTLNVDYNTKTKHIKSISLQI